ncbi:MAG: hypothetical protein AB7U76_24030 [Pirellulales bacterium]
MECCGLKASRQLEATVCPQCGVVGHEVGRETVGAMASLTVSAAVLAHPGFRFCETPMCEVVYYADDAVIERAAVRVPVHAKDYGLDVPLCYCFGHTRRSIAQEIATAGNSSASATITREIKARHCACEIKNPSGRCCLGDVRAYEKHARQSGVTGMTRPEERR